VAKAKLGYERTVSNDADIYDTLALINSHVNKDCNSSFVREVVKTLGPATDKVEFMHRLFDYYCRNVRYKLDEPGTEKVYTPARIIHEGAGDCKKAATFLAACLICAGIEPILKHVYYDNNEDYTHIYVIVANPDLQHYITLDPTNDCQWNKEVSYSGGGLYYLNGRTMKLKSMGAAPTTPQSKSWDSTLLKTLPFSEDLAIGCHNVSGDIEALSGPSYIGFSFKHKFHLPSLSNIIKDAEHVVMQVENKLATVSMVIPRGVFLGGVKTNTAGLAGNLLKLYAQDPNKVNTFWKDFGGDPNTLHAAIVEGAKKHPLLGPEYISGPEVILAAAAPIVAGAAAILASLKPGSPASKDLNALAGATMAAASGGGFDAIASAAATGYAADTTGSHAMPPNGQFTPPGHTPQQPPPGYTWGDGGHSGGSVGFMSMIMLMTMFNNNFYYHNYLFALLCFIGVYINVFLYKFSPLYFNHKKLWQKLLRHI